MKTSIKILLLVLITIGAIVGVLVFAKTRVAPPSSIVLVNQYSNDLNASCAAFTDFNDFSQCRSEYFRLSDRLQRFLSENAIEATVADDYKKKINDIYGENLTAYGFGLLLKSVWQENQLKDMQAMLSSLMMDKLTTGEDAVTDDFIASANKINKIVREYHAALRLSRNTYFNGINDASSRIKKAKSYMSEDYLRNNAALVKALNELPGRIAQSHLNYVRNLVNALGRYTSVSEDYYMELVRRTDKAIGEYKNTSIYGGNKPSISELESRAIKMISSAREYYED